jgi:hypothetical protein
MMNRRAHAAPAADYSRDVAQGSIQTSKVWSEASAALLIANVARTASRPEASRCRSSGNALRLGFVPNIETRPVRFPPAHAPVKAAFRAPGWLMRSGLEQAIRFGTRAGYRRMALAAPTAR